MRFTCCSNSLKSSSNESNVAMDTLYNLIDVIQQLPNLRSSSCQGSSCVNCNVPKLPSNNRGNRNCGRCSTQNMCSQNCYYANIPQKHSNNSYPKFQNSKGNKVKPGNPGRSKKTEDKKKEDKKTIPKQKPKGNAKETIEKNSKVTGGKPSKSQPPKPKSQLKDNNQTNVTNVKVQSRKSQFIPKVDAKKLSREKLIVQRCDNFVAQDGRSWIMKCGDKLEKSHTESVPLNYLFRAFRYEQYDNKKFKEVIEPLRKRALHVFSLAIDRQRLEYGALVNVLSRANTRSFSEALPSTINSMVLQTMKEDIDRQIMDRLMELYSDCNENIKDLLVAFKLAVDLTHKNRRVEIWRYNRVLKEFIDGLFSSLGILPRDLYEQMERDEDIVPKFVDNKSVKKSKSDKTNSLSRDNKIENNGSKDIRNIPSQTVVINQENITSPFKDLDIDFNLVMERRSMIPDEDVLQPFIQKRKTESDDDMAKKPQPLIKQNVKVNEEFPPLTRNCVFCKVELNEHLSLVKHMKKCLKQRFTGNRVRCPDCSEEFDFIEKEKFINHIIAHQDFYSAPGTL